MSRSCDRGYFVIDLMPTKQRLDSGKKLGIGKRLDQIIIPASHEANQLIRFTGFGSEKQKYECLPGYLYRLQ